VLWRADEQLNGGMPGRGRLPANADLFACHFVCVRRYHSAGGLSLCLACRHMDGVTFYRGLDAYVYLLPDALLPAACAALYGAAPAAEHAPTYAAAYRPSPVSTAMLSSLAPLRRMFAGWHVLCRWFGLRCHSLFASLDMPVGGYSFATVSRWRDLLPFVAFWTSFAVRRRVAHSLTSL